MAVATEARSKTPVTGEPETVGGAPGPVRKLPVVAVPVKDPLMILARAGLAAARAIARAARGAERIAFMSQLLRD